MWRLEEFEPCFLSVQDKTHSHAHTGTIMHLPTQVWPILQVVDLLYAEIAFEACGGPKAQY